MLVVSAAVEEELDELLLVLDVVSSSAVDKLVVSVSDFEIDDVVTASSTLVVGPEVNVEVDDDSSVEWLSGLVVDSTSVLSLVLLSPVDDAEPEETEL